MDDAEGSGRLAFQELWTIGQFARRTGLSERALRLYDSLKILAPVVVDPETGYRWYTSSQVRRATLARRLRAAQMPLATIREG